MDTAGAILSGGKNKRMGGKNKAFIEIEGRPLIQRALDSLRVIFDEIILVTNSPQDYTIYAKDCRIILDNIKNAGPLGGIHAALAATIKKNVFFIASDMPFLHNEIIKKQVAYFEAFACEALVPRIGDSIEPLHAIYSKSLANCIESYLKQASNYSVREFLKTIKTSYFELEDNFFNRKVFKNINTPQDLEEAGFRES